MDTDLVGEWRVHEQLFGQRDLVQVDVVAELVENGLVDDGRATGRDEVDAVALRDRADLVDAVAVVHSNDLVVARVGGELGDLAALERVDDADHALIVEQGDEAHLVLFVERRDRDGHEREDLGVGVERLL